MIGMETSLLFLQFFESLIISKNKNKTNFGLRLAKAWFADRGLQDLDRSGQPIYVKDQIVGI